MQSAAYNTKYAQFLKQDIDGKSPSDVLNLIIQYANWDFGSAMWFLSEQCEQGVRDGLKKGDDAGWNAYLGCIGTTATDDRKAYWTRAKGALGVK